MDILITIPSGMLKDQEIMVGLARIRFHDLRHTCASLLIEQGENIKYIQTQLGHASPSITMDVYAHLMQSTNQAAATRLENAVLNSVKKT